MNSVGWEELLCRYFYDTCKNVLDTYFLGYGFVPHKNKIGGVTYKKNDIFVEISYYPDSSPNYSLTIVIGVGSGAYDHNGKFIGIPIWAIIPDTGQESKFFTQTFSNINELEYLLNDMKSKILEKFVSPSWLDRSWIEEEQKKFNTS